MQFVAKNLTQKVVRHAQVPLLTSIRGFAKQTVKVPTMGDSISEGTVQEFVKKPGDFVNADEIVAVVETDKVMVDIRSPRAGTIEKFFAAQGETVQVNADFFVIETDGKPGAQAASAPKPEATKQEAPKAEAPKQEAPKQAAPPKQEAPQKQAEASKPKEAKPVAQT